MCTGAVYRDGEAAHGMPEILGGSPPAVVVSPPAGCAVKWRVNGVVPSAVPIHPKDRPPLPAPTPVTPCDAAAAAIAKNFCSIQDLDKWERKQRL